MNIVLLQTVIADISYLWNYPEFFMISPLFGVIILKLLSQTATIFLPFGQKVRIFGVRSIE